MKHEDAESLPIRPHRLVVTLDDAVRRVHPMVGEDVVFGRGADCGLVLEDVTVSRRHGRIFVQRGRIWVEDLASTHGTYVNGRKIDRAPLAAGDRIEIGPFHITLDEMVAETEAERTGTVDRRNAPAPSGRELDILLSLCDSLGADSHRAVALDRVMHALLKAMEAQRACLFRWDSRRAAPHRETVVVADGADPDAPLSETLLKQVAREREPYLVTDLMRAPDETPSVARLAAGHVQSILIAPLKLGRRLVGLLYLDSPAARRSFTTGDLDLLARTTIYLAGALDNVVARETLTTENERLRDLVGGSTDIPIDRLVAPGSPMEAVIAQLTRAASRDVTVLLTGETGTGKEVAARALHRLSPRAGGRFIAINCGAIPESLIESELFGYRKGSFTGANEDRAGLVEMAHQGTLFLDEVAELPLQSQVRLLRVLEERQVVRLGTTEPIPVDFRLVAATHRDLAAKVADGTFREDLMYRLKVFAITLPPLRARRVDLPLLVGYLIGTLAARLGVPVAGPAPDLLPTLTAYDWPGNIRELRNALDRALVVEASDVLTATGLPVEVRAGSQARPARGTTQKVRTRETGGVRKWAEVLRELERSYLSELMQQVGANVTAMARVSGLSRLTLYRKLGQLGLQVPAGQEIPADEPEEPEET